MKALDWSKSSATAMLIATPSDVDVPRPNSSIITREESVILSNIKQVSFISFVNDESRADSWLSCPMRVNNLSAIRKQAYSAGTKLPYIHFES